MAATETNATGADRRFVKKAMSAPLLDRDHELDLATRWRVEGDEDALHELCTAYMRLVVAIASRFRTYGLPMSDL
ncbi:MAG TPA: RNA polymerase factor sigma-32, partial [Hyphomonadaceae bacterium]|nr:RNA polymerase factor sigma-32 [Hyphomonadaceae bacterium]